ncbi:MAG TPA: hypothetical protein VH092_04945 [Urbifossiella sp.]|jgi:hypothetical protein|nr:hypothetical protein [Urbifossiella sp.]
MTPTRLALVLYLFVAAVVCSALWVRAEAEGAAAYYEDPERGRVPKFEFTTAEVVVIIGATGLVYATPAAAVGYGIGHLLLRVGASRGEAVRDVR